MSGRVLELAFDKFIFRFPEDLRYSESGVWVRLEGRRARIGLSDFTQQRNGDVTFVEPKEPGAVVRTGDEIAVVETIKVNVSVPCPVAGKVIEVNGALEESPEFVNLDPYGKGWMAVIEVEDGGQEYGALMTADAFLGLARRQAEAEARR